MMISENLKMIHQNIKEACARSGRQESEVTLVCVSKTRPMQMIRECTAAGEHVFGENYVQELVDKYMLQHDIQWHMIGHLQRNKVKYIIDKVSLIHSVDSLRLAAQIEAEAAKKDLCVDILLEVNIAEEASKWGFLESQVPDAVTAICTEYPHLRVRGLMTSAPYTEDAETNRLHFRRLHALFLSLQQSSSAIDTLSMGMTGDYIVAVEEGATMVRVGTGIFGERDYASKNDSSFLGSSKI